MKTPIVQLTRNLRKSLLQGDPWVYKQALAIPSQNQIQTATLCKLKDSKKEFVCWGMFCPNSPLAVRVLSLKKQPPTKVYYESLLQDALNLRTHIRSSNTDCYRLINGEGDHLPGMICDVYAHVAVIQFDGQGPYEFWDQEWLSEWILKNTQCRSVYYKPRHDQKVKPLTWGEPITDHLILVKENDCLFYVDIVHGQKTGFFLDQRDNRNYVKHISNKKTVLNLFSYSGGFSVYAGVGGATKVTSMDVAQGALDLAKQNWELNQLKPALHQTRCADVFDFVHHAEEKYDIVICDPPSLAKSEKHKEQAIQKYMDTFAAAARIVSPKGHLLLSSCSSHISFEDFQKIILSALSKSRKRGQILRVSGQGSDHPYPHACPHLRYLKFVDVIIGA